MTGLVWLLKMELPSYTVRLCDGAFQVWGAETFTSVDATFGTIGSVEAMSEGVGDEVPALELTFLPNPDAGPGDLSQPGFQQSPVKVWIAEFDSATHALVGTPDLVFSGQIDLTQLTITSTRELAMSVVSMAERLFELNIGNSLSDRWHQSVWPGELGHSNATGAQVQVAWGVERGA